MKTEKVLIRISSKRSAKWYSGRKDTMDNGKVYYYVVVNRICSPVNANDPKIKIME